MKPLHLANGAATLSVYEIKALAQAERITVKE
jgi:hypothetical protein